VHALRRIAAATMLVLAACSTGGAHPVGRSPTPGAPTGATTTAPSDAPTFATTGPDGPMGTPTPTVSTDGPSPTGSEPHVIQLRRIPEQGVAVDHGGSVVLHDLFTGRAIQRLNGFAIYDPTAAPAHLVLERGGTYYVLEEFRRVLRPLASRQAAARLAGHDQPGLRLPRPASGGTPLAGHWRYASTDPRYGDRELAQWSGECEVPTAFFVDLDEHDVTPVTGETDPATAPESFAEGWTKRGQAVVFLPRGACGAGATKPGVYLFRSPGKGRLLVTTPPDAFVHMWGNAIAD
jgi:hypothetical protein